MLTAATIVAASVSAISPARAAFHLWEVNEIYSNADGSVQFVELITPDQPFANNEHFVAGHRLITSTANPDNVFTFPTNLSTSIGTRNRTILIATPGFAQLPGAVTPDYTLPAVNFFSTVADTVRFDGNSGTTGRIIFAASQLPTDGVMSINRNLTPGVNSPKNFLNQVGSLTTPLTPGDVNGDGAVDRADAAQMAANLGRTAATREQGDLNGNGTVGLLDAAQLQLNLDLPLPAATSAVPEPGTIALALATLAAAGLIGLSRRSVSRRLQSRA
jgi:hypothetical protein